MNADFLLGNRERYKLTTRVFIGKPTVFHKWP